MSFRSLFDIKAKNEIFKFSNTERHYEICVTECKIV